MVIQNVGIAVLALEIMVILFQHPSRLQRDMIFLLVSLLIVFVAYTMEMQCRSAGEAMLAIKFGYLGKPFIAVSMLFLLLDYFRIRVPRWLVMLLVLLQAGVTLTVFTTEAHRLYYVSITFVESGLFPHVQAVHGPVYYIYMGTLFLYCAAMLALCIAHLRKKGCSVRERHQTWLFIVNISVPAASLGIYLTHVFQEYDCTLPAYLISVAIFLISFFRLDLFDAIILAKEQAVDYIHCGLLVYDNQERLIYQNDLARQMDVGVKAAELAKSGDPYAFEDRLYAVEDREIQRDGIIYGHMFFIQDVTDRYYYEKILREEKRRADEASRAKTEFLLSMSHDIRTPMNAILGMAKIASAHLEDREKVAGCLYKIGLSGQHLLGIINSILDMNKIESGTLELAAEPFDIGELLDELLTITRPLAEGSNHTIVERRGELEHSAVRGDRGRLSQALMNIIGNAVKYTPRGGTIWLSASEDPEELPPAGAAGERRRMYTFTIQDNGIGMSEEYLPRLFDPFTRARNSTSAKIQGTGLGMAITKRFIELMGGGIQVESKLGEGSRFIVTLPMPLQSQRDAELQAEQATIEDFASLDLSGKRVLLVEDNELNAEIAGEILGMTGLAVEYAANGQEAVDMVSACADGYYDLILMDILMPVMDGYEATRAIRALGRKHLPIIAVTANAFQEDVRRARQEGMNGHLAKPLDMTQLMGVLRRWLCGETPDK